jgi:hypothetical protein
MSCMKLMYVVYCSLRTRLSEHVGDSAIMTPGCRSAINADFLWLSIVFRLLCHLKVFILRVLGFEQHLMGALYFQQ